jgi:hypothetical protein
MPKVPDLNIPKREFGKWQPDKQEIYNMRFWKAKPAKTKPVIRSKKKRTKIQDKRLFNDIHDQDQHLRNI